MPSVQATTVPTASLEYVVTEGCSDCVAFEALDGDDDDGEDDQQDR